MSDEGNNQMNNLLIVILISYLINKYLSINLLYINRHKYFACLKGPEYSFQLLNLKNSISNFQKINFYNFRFF